ncbi:MAG: hypothetical protein PUF62_09775 [Bacteroidales bacterium]|nr:hypothetical protein [Bacteroidales bacterium]
MNQHDQAKQRKAVEVVRKEEANETEISKIKTTETKVEEYDLFGLEEIDTRHKNMSSSVKGSGCITIINHARCGRRVHLANGIWRDLNCLPYVKLYIKDKQLFVTANATGGIAVKFNRTISFSEAVEDYTGKIVLYATATVKRLTAEWNLKFDSNCCYTGGTYKKCSINGAPAVVISLDEDVEA